MAQELDLSTIFSAVTKTLSENEKTLNAEDSYNHDHGTNMVNTFKLVQKAVTKQKAKPAADQLAYASQVLREKSTSGSAKVYANGLEDASRQLAGKSLNPQTIGTLINAMMGSGSSTADSGGGGDIITSLLGNVMGSSSSGSGSSDMLGSLLSGLGGQTSQNSGGSDMLSSLLGGLTGGGSGSSQSSSGGAGMLGSLLGGLTGSQQESNDGLDIGDVLSAGMAYLSAKQGGDSNMEAIMQALSTSSPLGQRDDRKQSGALIINTILGLLGKK